MEDHPVNEGVSEGEEEDDDEHQEEATEDVHQQSSPAENASIASGTCSKKLPVSHSQENSTRPASNQHIQFTLKDGATGKATVLSKQPKRIGKWGDWLNVQLDGNSEPSSINWKNVTDWKQLPAPEKVVLLSSVEKMSQGVIDAKFKEISNLVENNVFDVVPDTGQRRISTKWVITEKIKKEKKIIKARLVARGFEEKLENTRTDSLTCSCMSLRLFHHMCIDEMGDSIVGCHICISARKQH